MFELRTLPNRSDYKLPTNKGGLPSSPQERYLIRVEELREKISQSIQSASVGAENQILLDLKLDTIQTYYFNPAIKIADCMILRAHLDRFIRLNNDEFAFPSGDLSEMFIAEQTEPTPKRLIKRKVLNFEIDISPNSEFNEWIKENIYGWQYYFITRSGEEDEISKFWIYKSSTGMKEETTIDVIKYMSPSNVGPNSLNSISDTNKINGALVCICVPVYKKESDSSYMRNCIQIGRGPDSSTSISINSNGIKGFKEMNGNNSRIFASKFSILPPFVTDNYSSRYTINRGLNVLKFTGTSLDGTFFSNIGIGLRGLWTLIDDESHNGVILVDTQYALHIFSEFYTSDSKFIFNKNEIIGSQKKWEFNPKLLSSNYREVNLVFNGNKFTYDLQKLSNNSFRIKYSEAMTPDITKGYFRIDIPFGSLYIQETTENLTGLVYSNDQSLMVDNNKLGAMLAENKNFALQQITNIISESAKNVVNGFSKGGVPGAMLGLGTGVATSLFNLGTSMDNMRSSPNEIKNASGNIIFSNLISPLGPTIEEYDILEIDKIRINDYMFMNGFICNKVGNIKNFDNLRYYFNFIQAIIDTISGIPISNDARRDIKERFSNGIRFWNSDEVQYDLENYERLLIEF